MVLYGIMLACLEEELQEYDLSLLSPFYSDSAAFSRSARRITHLLKQLMERAADRGHLYDLTKSIFISDSPDQEQAAKREFEVEGLDFNFVGGSWYLGYYLGP